MISECESLFPFCFCFLSLWFPHHRDFAERGANVLFLQKRMSSPGITALSTSHNGKAVNLRWIAQTMRVCISSDVNRDCSLPLCVCHGWQHLENISFRTGQGINTGLTWFLLLKAPRCHTVCYSSLVRKCSIRWRRDLEELKTGTQKKVLEGCLRIMITSPLSSVELVESLMNGKSSSLIMAFWWEQV